MRKLAATSIFIIGLTYIYPLANYDADKWQDSGQNPVPKYVFLSILSILAFLHERKIIKAKKAALDEDGNPPEVQPIIYYSRLQWFGSILWALVTLYFIITIFYFSGDSSFGSLERNVAIYLLIGIGSVACIYILIDAFMILNNDNYKVKVRDDDEEDES